MKEKVAGRVQAYRALLACLEMELCRDIDKKTNEQVSVLDQHKNTLLQALSNFELREADMNNNFHEFLTRMPRAGPKHPVFTIHLLRPVVSEVWNPVHRD